MNPKSAHITKIFNEFLLPYWGKLILSRSMTSSTHSRFSSSAARWACTFTWALTPCTTCQRPSPSAGPAWRPTASGHRTRSSGSSSRRQTGTEHATRIDSLTDLALCPSFTVDLALIGHSLSVSLALPSGHRKWEILCIFLISTVIYCRSLWRALFRWMF